LAALNSDNELINLFCENGANVNSLDNAGRTPLLLALSTNKIQTSTVKLLLSKGADPNIRDVGGENAWDLAAKANSDIAKALKDYKQTTRQP
jgi:ankyrin repeat protein